METLRREKMILDKISNSSSYVNTHPLFAKAFAYLEDYLKNPVAPGKYEICGDDLYVMVQDYETREEGLLEVHRKYIDIQCMVEGVEKMYYAQFQDLEAEADYDEKGDAQFLKEFDNCLEFLFKAGDFAIFFPQDAHKPSMNPDGKVNAKKLVFKVKLDA
jgi:YhcH/YjgK/YiaL family protein